MAVQPRVTAWLAARGERHVHGGAPLLVGVFLTGIYGGYFGAAQGVILIALLAIFIDDDLQRLNGTKNALALVVNGVAGVVFVLDRPRLVVGGRPHRRRVGHRRPARRPLRPAPAGRRPAGVHRGRRAGGGDRPRRALALTPLRHRPGPGVTGIRRRRRPPGGGPPTGSVGGCPTRSRHAGARWRPACPVAASPGPARSRWPRRWPRAVAGGRHLVVQAGTGTGKSLAYLVPAALSGEKVVVATATKALQDQLADKDLPLVAGATDARAHLRRAEGAEQLRLPPAGLRDRRPHRPADPDPRVRRPARRRRHPGPRAAGDDTSDPATLADQVRSLVRWAGDTTTGDRAELPFEPHFRAWAMVSTTARECPGAFRCPSGRDCFAEDARARAAEADVVVVNTHLYGAHLASGGRRAARAPGGGLRRGPRGRGRDDRQPRARGRSGSVPGAGHGGPTGADADDDRGRRAVEAVADLADVFHRVLRPAGPARRVPRRRHRWRRPGRRPGRRRRGPHPGGAVERTAASRSGSTSASPRSRRCPDVPPPPPPHRRPGPPDGRRPRPRHAPGPGHRSGGPPGRPPAPGRARGRRVGAVG